MVLFLNNKISKSRHFNSFSWRLSLKFTGLVTVILVCMVVMVIFVLNSLVRKQQSSELKSALYEIESGLNSNQEYFENLPYYITYSVYEKNTGEVYLTNDPFLPRLSDTNGKSKIHFEKNYFSDGDLQILYMSKNLNSEYEQNNDSNQLIILTALNIDSDYISKMIGILPKIVVPFVLVIVLISFIISYSMTKKTISPVVEITKKAKGISLNNLDTQLPVSKHEDEIDALSSTFNELFSQIKQDFEREKQFSNDVSHELKTPLAVINGQTSLLLRWGKDDPVQLEKSLNSIKAEIKSMQNIIEKLLQLSRMERGLITVEKNVFSVLDFFNGLKEEFQSSDENTLICISVDCDNQLMIETDREILHQIFTVFISNSLKYKKTDEPCKIQLVARREKNGVISLIENDNGIGFTQEDLPKVFDRFYIGDKARTRKEGNSSTGLGLSIAKSLCCCLDAEISAENNEQGGASMKVIFNSL